MDISSIFVTLGLALLATAYVLYPLYRGRKMKKTQTVSTMAKDTPLQDSEQTARLSLQEVELDYQLGNIAESDYRTLRERYMRRALVAFKSRLEAAPQANDIPGETAMVGTDLSRPHPPTDPIDPIDDKNDSDENIEHPISESAQDTAETELDALIEEQLRAMREKQVQQTNHDGSEEHE